MAGGGPALIVRVLLLVDCYLPHPKSQAKLIHDLGVELTRQGHDVVIAAPSQNVASRFEVNREEGMRVLRVRARHEKPLSKVLRALQEERLSSVMWRGARSFLEKESFELIVYYSPTIFFGRLVRRLKRLWGCPAYLVLRDIFPQWAVDAGLLRKGLAWRFLRHRELQQYAVADVIGVQSPHNLAYFHDEVAHRRVEVLYNWASVDEEVARRSNIRSRLGLDDRVIFFYGGNIGVAQDMDNVVRLARSIPKNVPAFFLLVGQGTETERLRSIIATEHVDNMMLLPAVDQEEYASMLRVVDVGLISLDRRLTTHNFPGKMLGYMQAGLPILASLNPGNDLGPILDEHAAGRWSVNGDDAGLLEGAVSLATDPSLRERMGKSSRRLLEARFSAGAAARQVVARWSAVAS